MNKYLRAIVVIPTGIVKTIILKIFHPRSFKGVQFAEIAPSSEITLDHGKMILGKGLKLRDNAKIRVRKNAFLELGKNVAISSNCIIACRECITIGDGTEVSPNVFIYDHDHDTKTGGGLHLNEYKTSSIVIGKNVWIGCNTVILRGTVIGDNAVIAAGSVVKGTVPSNCIFIQKRKEEIKVLQNE